MLYPIFTSLKLAIFKRYTNPTVSKNLTIRTRKTKILRKLKRLLKKRSIYEVVGFSIRQK